jgi:hypothetical protein
MRPAPVKLSGKIFGPIWQARSQLLSRLPVLELNFNATPDNELLINNGNNGAGESVWRANRGVKIAGRF